MNTLTKKKRMGYCFGITTESLLYNMFYTYYLTFLIEIVGIQPRWASIIIFISIAWDAITDPTVGNFADRPGVNKNKMMKVSIIPLVLSFILAWTAIGTGLSSQLLKIVIYTVITLFIWLFYTTYTIPYYAVVAEITEDYNERTHIRSVSSLINAGVIALGNMLPALAPTIMIYVGRNNAYFVLSIIVSIIAVATGFICTKSLEGVYKPREASGPVEKISLKQTFATFGEIFRLKPTKWLVIFIFFFLVGNSMIQANLSYMVVDCIGMEYDTGIVIVIITLVVTMALMVPIVEKFANKTDRRTACIIFIGIAAVGEVVLKLIGLDAEIGGFKIMAVATAFMLGLAMGTFWTFFYSMAYDLVELDEYVNGTRRESVITGLPQLFQKSGSAIGILLTGQLLSLFGYDSSADVAGSEALIPRVYDAHIVNGMENIATIIPAACFVVAVIAVILYPMTRKKVALLNDKLADRREGKETNNTGLEGLL